MREAQAMKMPKRFKKIKLLMTLIILGIVAGVWADFKAPNTDYGPNPC